MRHRGPVNQENQLRVKLATALGGIAFVFWVAAMVYVVEKDSVSSPLVGFGGVFAIASVWNAYKAGQR